MKKIKYILLFTIILHSFYTNAFEVSDYESEKIEEANFDDAKWEEVINGKNFDEKRPKPKKRKRDNSSEPVKLKSSSSNSFLEGTVGKIILFTLIIGVLATIIYLIVRQNLGLGNKKVGNEIVYEVDALDAEAPEETIEEYLLTATNNKDYRTAIRMYYLLIIKSLSDKELILWAKEKTNFDYLFELNQHNYYNTFKAITLNFETVWYGDVQIDENQFTSISSKFKSFLNQLSPSNEK